VIQKKLIEGTDYYLEGGLFVLTAQYLKERGHCCKSGCRHCPYGFSTSQEKGEKAVLQSGHIKDK